MKGLRAYNRILAMLAAFALLATAPGLTRAEDEGVRTGVVQEVDRDRGVVVIGDRPYRTLGRQVQPPQGLDPEDSGYRSRPFREGMIVRFTLEPGDPPAIQEAWAVDR